jgi:hypothetical protein
MPMDAGSLLAVLEIPTIEPLFNTCPRNNEL